MLAENVERLEDHDQSDPIEERISEIVSDKWTMYFDGAVNLAGSGIEAILISLTGQHHPVATNLVSLVLIISQNTRLAYLDCSWPST